MALDGVRAPDSRCFMREMKLQDLKRKSPTDLLAFAEELTVENAGTMRKQELMFAIITPALISGAIADRAKYGSWVIFVAVWITLVYIPIAHWAFASQGGEGGWIIDKLKALDFAGGTVVEINSGAAALALALVLGKRDGFRKDPMRPHNMPLVLLGAGML